MVPGQTKGLLAVIQIPVNQVDDEAKIVNAGINKMTSGQILLRFKHPTRDLAFLASVLSMPCSISWVAGSPRQTPRGDSLPGIRSDSYWTSKLKYPCENGFQEQLIYIIDRLARAKIDFHEFKVSGGRIEIYFQLPGSKNNGDTIESICLKTLGEMGVDLLIEVFPGT